MIFFHKIQQYFDKGLLSTPTPKFKDDSEILIKVFNYIDAVLSKKTKNLATRDENYQKMKKEFLYLYDRATLKEADIKEKTGKEAKMPFYFITVPHKSDRDLFNRLRFKGRSYRMG